jgi:predicted Ser/Thr protein kinase
VGDTLTAPGGSYLVEISDNISSGAYGSVYAASMRTGEQCAVKIFRGDEPETEWDHEQKVLFALSGCSPYVIKYKDAFRDEAKGVYCIIMPRCVTLATPHLIIPVHEPADFCYAH